MHAHIYNGILFKLKKGEKLPFVTTWMDHGSAMLSEISQMKKNKNHMTSLACKTEKKQTKQKQIDSENR